MNRKPVAANMVNQLFNAGDPDQYKRELVQNAIDAGATDIEAGAIRLGEFGEEGGVKAAFVDNGRGMSATEKWPTTSVSCSTAPARSTRKATTTWVRGSLRCRSTPSA